MRLLADVRLALVDDDRLNVAVAFFAAVAAFNFAKCCSRACAANEAAADCCTRGYGLGRGAATGGGIVVTEVAVGFSNGGKPAAARASACK